MPNIADHPDDRGPVPSAVHGDARTDRISAVPVARAGRVDQHHALRRLVVGRPEAAAAQQRDAERREVVWACDAHVGRRGKLRVAVVAALDLEPRLSRAHARERHRVRDGGGRHARNGL